ncbi:hypothetical protein PoB_007080500 [Plakobranchus ocellatus]|uniref:Uncharacterized protein n=1 Tax=Plakobranchus ocellatus TaxID=259542 RepID=A0AAV4DJZ2_9GAST|nr:hypothetical protein PoB_007080500 [Plakobranchus ocellatus]
MDEFPAARKGRQFEEASQGSSWRREEGETTAGQTPQALQLDLPCGQGPVALRRHTEGKPQRRLGKTRICCRLLALSSPIMILLFSVGSGKVKAKVVSRSPYSINLSRSRSVTCEHFSKVCIVFSNGGMRDRARAERRHSSPCNMLAYLEIILELALPVKITLRL